MSDKRRKHWERVLAVSDKIVRIVEEKEPDWDAIPGIISDFVDERERIAHQQGREETIIKAIKNTAIGKCMLCGGTIFIKDYHVPMCLKCREPYWNKIFDSGLSLKVELKKEGGK